MDTRFFIPELTFVVFTFNEAARLPGVIKNFRAYGRILVVDNFSTDETVMLARAADCEVLLHKNPGWVEDFGTTEKVKAAVQTPWIYWAFADEIIMPDVLADIKRAIETDQFDIISIMRKNYFYGQFCHEIAASYQTKAFKKQALDFRENTLHNFGKPTVQTDRIYRMRPDKFIHHLISNTATSYLNTINRYTDMEMAAAPGPYKASVLQNFLSQALTLMRDYFFRGGYKSGRPGMTLSVFMLIYSLVDQMKRYEASQRIDPARVAHECSKVSEQLLQDFR